MRQIWEKGCDGKNIYRWGRMKGWGREDEEESELLWESKWRREREVSHIWEKGDDGNGCLT